MLTSQKGLCYKELASTKYNTDQGTIYNSCIHEQRNMLQAFQMLENNLMCMI